MNLLRRIMVTIAGIAVYRLAAHVPLPCVDVEAMSDLAADAPIRSFQQVSALPFGINPYLTAAILVLLLSSILSPLRRLREGTAAQHLTFDRLIYFCTVFICLIQSFALGLALERIETPSGLHLVADPGWGFRLTTMITVTATTLVVVWMAEQVTIRGIGNGVVLFILADIVKQIGPAVMIQYRQEVGNVGTGDLLGRLMVYLLLLAIPVLTVLFVSAQRRVLLQRGNEQTSVFIPLRVNAAGIIPILGAHGLATVLVMSHILQDDGTLRWLICGLITLPLTYAYVAITFSPKEVLRSVYSLGCTLRDAASREEAQRIVRSTMWLTTFPGAVLLSVVAVLPQILTRWFAVTEGFANHFGIPLLVLSAICVDALHLIRQGQGKFQRIPGSVKVPAEGWVPIIKTETRLEAELVQDFLLREEIPTDVRHSRAIPILGTLAFWESSRPTLPSLTIHRRLGAGQVTVLVQAGQFQEAAAAFAEAGLPLETSFILRAAKA